MATVNQPNPNHLYVNTQYIKDPAPYKLGNSAPLISQIRGFPTYNEDVNLMKTFAIKERFKVQIRGDFLNLFNRHQFWNPDTWPSSSTFGQVTGVTDDHREAQVGLRLDF
jgi:hypothetical protein